MTCLEPAPVTSGRPTIECLRCHQHKTHKGRGLCSACWQHLRTRGMDALEAYPTTPRPAPATTRRIVECLRCETEQQHWARGLCQRCYNFHAKRDELDQFPATVMSLDVDEVQVQRAVDWIIAYAAMAPADRVDYRKRRPAMTRGERIEVLRRVRFNVRLHVATRALGISGRKVNEYFDAAGIR